MNATFIKFLVVALFGASLNQAHAKLIMACQGSSSSCGGVCAALGGSQNNLGGGANGDIWLCNSAAVAQQANSNPIGSLKPTTEVAPAPKSIPRCTSVRRDFVNKTGQAPVDVNVAPRDALIKVPGISTTAAQQIISERSKAQFSNWDDVLQRAKATRCIDFTGSPLQVMTRVYNPRGGNPAAAGW